MAVFSMARSMPWWRREKRCRKGGLEVSLSRAFTSIRILLQDRLPWAALPAGAEFEISVDWDLLSGNSDYQGFSGVFALYSQRGENRTWSTGLDSSDLSELRQMPGGFFPNYEYV